MPDGRPLGREVLVKGYLRKSPPLEKAHALRFLDSLLCAGHKPTDQRWKRRYCVFYKVRHPNETEVFFEYYKDETEKQFRGCVDLKSCDCISANKTFDKLANIFTIETRWQGRPRTYCFSAESQEAMNEWIHQLTCVLNMIPDQPASGTQLCDRLRRPLDPFPGLSTPLQTPSHGRFPPPNLVNQDDGVHRYHDTTGEYRISFGDAPYDSKDDDEYYRFLPLGDHAYVNLNEESENRETVPPDAACHQLDDTESGAKPRPNSVYLQMWDSSAPEDGHRAPEPVLRKKNPTVLVYRKSRMDLDDDDDTEPTDGGVQVDHRVSSPTPDACPPHPKEPPPPLPHPDRIEAVLPVRTVPAPESDSSSACDDDDEEEEEDQKEEDGVSGDGAPADGAGEAEESPSKIPSNGTERSTDEVNDSGLIQYLDAVNIEFPSDRRPGPGRSKPPPAVPPKPAHLRKTTTPTPPVSPLSIEGSTPTHKTATVADASSQPSGEGIIEYQELDPVSTMALALVADVWRS